MGALLAQETTTTTLVDWAFLQDGIWWLAIGGILATLTVGITTAVLSNKRTKDDREFQSVQREAERKHQDRMLKYELDRQKGLGQHDTFLSELDAIDRVLEKIIASDLDPDWGPGGLYRTTKSDDSTEVAEAIGRGQGACDWIESRLHAVALGTQHLGDRGWTEELREQAINVGVAISEYDEYVKEMHGLWSRYAEGHPPTMTEAEVQVSLQRLHHLNNQLWNQPYLLRQMVSES